MNSQPCGRRSPISRTISQADLVDGVAINPTSPKSNWPGLPDGLDQQSTSGVAGNIATNAGAIGAVQVKYATDLGFGPNTPDKGVASVLNAERQVHAAHAGRRGLGPRLRQSAR